MKKIITLVLLAVTMTAQAQTHLDPYQPLMDAIDKQGEDILSQYRALQEKDPKGELPESKAKAKILSDRLDSLGEVQLNLVREIIRDNKDNELPVKYIKDALYQLSYEDLKAALAPRTAYYNSPELAEADNDVTLSQWVGKGNYVLVDFWASWCGPCRREMPYVIKAYELYHGKGFEVVGVSFDQKKDAWVNAIQQMGMKWPQMSDLKGWKCAASDLYGINSIPSNVLVDPTGKIVSMDLRGQKLLNTLKDIYGE